MPRGTVSGEENAPHPEIPDSGLVLDVILDFSLWEGKSEFSLAGGKIALYSVGPSLELRVCGKEQGLMSSQKVDSREFSLSPPRTPFAAPGNKPHPL